MDFFHNTSAFGEGIDEEDFYFNSFSFIISSEL